MVELCGLKDIDSKHCSYFGNLALIIFPRKRGPV